MKSKFVKSLGLTAAMVACAGMTAFAAPSPSAKVEQTTKTEASSPKTSASAASVASIAGLVALAGAKALVCLSLIAFIAEWLVADDITLVGGVAAAKDGIHRGGVYLHNVCAVAAVKH